MSVSMLRHTEGLVIQSPSCFENPCKLLSGYCYGDENPIFPLTQDPRFSLEYWAQETVGASMPWPPMSLCQNLVGTDGQEDSSLGMALFLSFLV